MEMSCANCGKTKVGSRYREACETKLYCDGRPYCNMWSPMPCTTCGYYYNSEACDRCDREHSEWVRMTKGDLLRNVKDVEDTMLAVTLSSLLKWVSAHGNEPQDIIEWLKQGAYKDEDTVD